VAVGKIMVMVGRIICALTSFWVLKEENEAKKTKIRINKMVRMRLMIM
jgi:hypothetical protein